MTPLLHAIVSEVIEAGQKHSSGAVLVFDAVNLEAAILRGMEKYADESRDRLVVLLPKKKE